jgi:hypothetical protein
VTTIVVLFTGAPLAKRLNIKILDIMALTLLILKKPPNLR